MIGRDESHSIEKNSVDTGANQRPVTDFFTQQASNYSTHFDPNKYSGAAVLFQTRRRLVVDLLVGEKPSALLDIAVGSGEITHATASSLEFDELRLNDISPKMLRLAQRVFNERLPAGNIAWSNDDAFDLLTKAGPDKFDVILCLGLIAHTGRLSELLERIFVCLRPGGVLVLQSTLNDHLGAWVISLYARSPFRQVPYKVTAYSKHEILTAATTAGFDLAEMRRYGLSLPFGDRILGRLNYRFEKAYAEKLTKRGAEVLLKLRKPM